MMTRRIFIWVFCFLCLHLPGQEWMVSYVGGHLWGHTTLVDGFVDGEGVAFFAGCEGADKDHTDALLMRIEPDGTHTEFRYERSGCHSKATCVIEMSDHNLFVAGNLSDANDDYVMVLILDKQLNLLQERQYGKEVEAVSFRNCKAALDNHHHVIVSTAVVQNNSFQGTDLHGVFFKFNEQGELVSHRYLIEDYPDPLYFFMDFRLRQMWYQEVDETLLCLCTGYGGVLSFVTFDSAFNYLEEHPIWREEIDRSDHTLNREDCYTDYWYNDEEALFFSSRGDYDHNKLRVSRVNTRGEFLDFICLNERPDTIDDAATSRCMAAVNDSTFYFLCHSHTWALYPGIGCVYQLNGRHEILGRHLDDEHQCYQSRMVLPTSDHGCIVVYDSCVYQSQPHVMHPVIKKLTPDDFEKVFLSVETQKDYPIQIGSPYPNPASQAIFIPLEEKITDNCRLRISDSRGLVVLSRIVNAGGCSVRIDISSLKHGAYQYQLSSIDGILQTGKFIKE